MWINKRSLVHRGARIFLCSKIPRARAAALASLRLCTSSLSWLATGICIPRFFKFYQGLTLIFLLLAQISISRNRAALDCAVCFQVVDEFRIRSVRSLTRQTRPYFRHSRRTELLRRLGGLIFFSARSWRCLGKGASSWVSEVTVAYETCRLNRVAAGYFSCYIHPCLV